MTRRASPSRRAAELPASDAWEGQRNIPRCGPVLNESLELIAWLCSPDQLITMGDDWDLPQANGAIVVEPSEGPDPLTPK